MAPLTQILLIVSYFIIGLVTAIILPRVTGIPDVYGGFVGVFIFCGAWQMQNWIVINKTGIRSRARLDKLEYSVHLLRKDLERARREVVNRSKEGEEKNEMLVDELKILQTLLGQLTAKERQFTSAQASETQEVSEEEVLELSVDHLPEHKEETKSNELKLSEEDIITDEEIEKLELTAEEAALVVIDDGTPDSDTAIDADGKPEKPKDPRRQKRAPIRLIKKESQLLKVVRDSLSENRVDLYLQPIVELPSRKKMHYECFSRVRDEEGRIVLPRQYLKVAEDKGLIGTIDNLLLFRLIQLIRRMGKRNPGLRFFCNMSKFSMDDDEFFPQFIDFMASNKEFADRLVFEISQEDFYTLDKDVQSHLQSLARTGFAFSMDSVTDFSKDFGALKEHRFEFIKADLADVRAEYATVEDFEAFVADLRRKNIKFIASRIEAEDAVVDVSDVSLEFGQGYLFGEPTAATELNQEL